MLGIECLAAVQLWRWIVHVIVHPDQARDYRVPGQIDYRCSLGRLSTGSRRDALNLTVADDEGLILFCDSSSTVDNADMSQNNRWLIVFHERFYVARELRR